MEFVLLVKTAWVLGFMGIYCQQNVAACSYFCNLHASPFDLINRTFTFFFVERECLHINFNC